MQFRRELEGHRIMIQQIQKRGYFGLDETENILMMNY